MDDNCALCALHRHHRRPQSPSPSTSITFHLPLHFIQGAKATVTQRSATRSDLNHGGFRSRLHRERDNMQKSEFLKALSDMWKDFDSRVLRYKFKLQLLNALHRVISVMIHFSMEMETGHLVIIELIGYIAGGCTRLLRTRIRVGDAAPMAYIEFIDRENELRQAKPPAPQPPQRPPLDPWTKSWLSRQFAPPKEDKSSESDA